MVGWLFLAVPQGCLQFVIVVFPDHTHLLFFTTNCSTLNESTIVFYIFLLFLLSADNLFSKLTFSKHSFRNTVRVSNSLIPEGKAVPIWFPAICYDKSRLEQNNLSYYSKIEIKHEAKLF